MAEVKWIKIVTDIFDDEKMLLIESLPSADSIIVIWFKLLCLAGKNNNSGVFTLNDKIAYTDEMLATIFRREVNTVRLALKTFENYGMIEIINDVITIPNWDKHQNLDSLEKRRERQKVYMKERREKQKLLANCEANSKANCKANVSPLEEEGEEDKNKIRIEKYIEKWNSLNINTVLTIKNNRLKSLKARIEEYGEDNIIKAMDNITKSKFLKGENDRGWRIDIDWLLKPNNFPKVLEGNYTDVKTEKTKGSSFNNFEPRSYDYDDLEKKLLGWDKDE